MASSNQADTSPGGKKPKAKKLSQKEQSERFIEAARSLGAEDSEDKFEAAFSAVVRREEKT